MYIGYSEYVYYAILLIFVRLRTRAHTRREKQTSEATGRIASSDSLKPG